MFVVWWPTQKLMVMSVGCAPGNCHGRLVKKLVCVCDTCSTTSRKRRRRRRVRRKRKRRRRRRVVVSMVCALSLDETLM